MKIILLRHGKPDIDVPEKIRSNEIVEFITRYDAAGIAADSMPPESSMIAANSIKAVVCSHLPRSLDSAKKLTQQSVLLSDEIFREAELPSSNWAYPRLNTMTWFLICRTLWLFGYSQNGESIAKTRKRAKLAADKLEEIAQQHESLLFVGHGFINHFIAKELKRRGWKGAKKSPREHWEYSTYEHYL
ncbi:MAG TPA: hypothetical protein EYG68_08720 [Leucothrix mucor]|nr:hypothetical protein [Leucothrix mucor]